MPQSLSVNLGLSLIPDVKEPETFSALIRVHNAINSLALALDVYTGLVKTPQAERAAISVLATLQSDRTSRIYVLASETMAFGQLINVYNVAGVSNARLASSTNTTKQCIGYCADLTGVVAGQYAEIVLFGLLPIGGGIIGTTYYLGTGAGTLASARPAAVGNIVQAVAYCLHANYLMFNPSLLFNIV